MTREVNMKENLKLRAFGALCGLTALVIAGSAAFKHS